MEDEGLAALRVRAIVGGTPLVVVVFLGLVAVSTSPVRPIPVVLVAGGLLGLAAIVAVQHVRYGPFPRGPRFWVLGAGAAVVAGPMIAALGPGPSTAFSVTQSFVVMTIVVITFDRSVQVVAGVGHAVAWLLAQWAFNDPATDEMLTGVVFQIGSLAIGAYAAWFFRGHVLVAAEANETARRARAEAELARVQERRRLAEALHDHALRFVTDAIEDLADAPQDEVHVLAAREQLARALRALRGLTLNMQEEQVADMTPGAALEYVVAEAVGDGQLEVDLQMDGEVDWRHTVLLVEATRELLTNVRRHAAARRAWVRVRAQGGGLRLSVEDDGVGIGVLSPTVPLEEGRLGLWRLRRHAEVLGGRFEVAGRAEGGTRAVLAFEAPSGPAAPD